MNAYVIGQPGETAATIASVIQHGGQAQTYVPVPVEAAADMLTLRGLRWTYPLTGFATLQRLHCHAYRTRDQRARVSCFLAHHDLWRLSADTNTALMVLESDAVFVRFFDPAELDGFEDRFGMVSLNDPRGATRLAGEYHRAIQRDACDEHRRAVVEVPYIDNHDIPQGLPGHSAYVIQPWFAHLLLAKAQAVGAWPNDALANKQFFPGMLGCLTNYATKVTGRKSTLA